jgi:hypothetical protein
MRRASVRAALVVTLVAAAGSPAQQDTPAHGLAHTRRIVVPNGYAAHEGNGGNYHPWNQYSILSYLHMQQIYDSSNFTDQGVRGPVRIVQLRFRADGTGGTWGGGMWSNVRIDMSSATVDYRAPNLSFAQNHGADRATVNQSPQVAVAAGTSRSPGPWYVTVPIHAFVYDPTTGRDLLVDIEIQSGLVGTSFHTDHVQGSTNPPPLGTRLITILSGSPVGTSVSIDYTPVTEFLFEPVAGYRKFADGCAGTRGLAGNRVVVLPRPGQDLVATIDNVPLPGLAVVLLGLGTSTSTAGPLPFDLGPFGAPGCHWHVADDAGVLLLGAGGSVTLTVPIPWRAALLGLRFHSQAAVLDAGANALGMVVSDACAAHVGW